MRVGVIGGGVMGLVFAYRLAQAGINVQVLERGVQVGGLSTWFDYGDFVWDKYYHVILRSDAYLLQLLKELDLGDSLYWKKTKTGFLWKGELHSVSNLLEFLRFPPLTWLQKIRLAGGLLYCRVASPSLEGVTAADWLRSVFGRSVYESFWEPLITSKFGVLKERVPAALLYGTISRYLSTRAQGTGKEEMGHLKGGGLRIFLQQVARRIEELGGKVRCGQKVHRISIGQEEIHVRGEGQEWNFDRVVSTVPRAVFQSLAPEAASLFQGRAQPEFLGVIRLALVLKRPLSPFYITNLLDKGHPFTGIIDVTRLTDGTELGGRQLVMIPRYDVPQSEWFQKKDQEIADLFLDALKKTWPDLEENLVRAFVHREKIVQAIWTTTPSSVEEKPQMTPDRRIWIVNGELAGRDPLNNNGIIRAADRGVKIFLETL